MLDGFVNTTFILVVSVAGTILIGTMAAYAIDRFQFRFKKLVVGAVPGRHPGPGVTTQVATFQIVNGLGLYNTRLGADRAVHGHRHRRRSTSSCSSCGRSRSRSTRRRRIDGANRFTIYWRDHPAAAQAGDRHRGDHQGHRHLQRVLHPVPLHAVAGSRRHLDVAVPVQGTVRRAWEVISAGAVLVIIPTLIVFLLLQRYIYNGFTAGAVK